MSILFKEEVLNNINKCKEKNLIDNICKAYCLDLYNRYEKSEKLLLEILNKIKQKQFDIFEVSIFLLTLAEHIRLTKNRRLLNDNNILIEDLMQFLVKECEKDNRNIFGDYDNRHNTSTHGCIYGALLSINNYVKNDFISQKIKEIKNYIFLNNILSGTLTNGNINKEVSIDIIVSVVPFGMFSPEDLILVEAVKEMEEKLVTANGVKKYLNSKQEDPFSTLLMSWYFAEKGDYNKAKVFLKQAVTLGIENVIDSLLYLIVVNKLEVMGEIGDNKIIHKPYGNNNRYEPQIYERFPKMPKIGEKVLINAVTWPINEKISAVLKYRINNDDEICKKGKLINRGTDSFWQWEIGSFNELDKISYYIELEVEEKVSTEIFKFIILKRNNISKITNMSLSNGLVKLSCLDNEGRIIPELKIAFKKSNAIELKFNQLENNSKIENTVSDVKFEESKETYKFICGENVVIVSKDPFSITITSKGNEVYKTHEKGIVFFEDENGEIKETEIFLKAQENEDYYGFGERYNDINQKCNSPDVYVYNQYKEQGIRTYLPIPFFISSKGYGIYVSSNSYIKYDMEESIKGINKILLEDNKIDLYIITGCPKDIVGRYSDITGRPARLPKWAFGPWMSSNNWDSDFEVRKQVELTKKYNIPSTVLVIEAWSDEATYYIFNDAVYDENDGEKGLKYSEFKFPKWGRWPDPKGLVNYLHNNNLKCILWQIPIVKYMNGMHHLQKDIDEEFMIKEEYCIKNSDNSPYRMPEGWFKDSVLIDYTNPKASKWWFDKRKYLVDDIGVDGFKTDGGEFIFGTELKFYGGQSANEMRNLYPNKYIESYYKFINELNPNGGITFSRAGFTGCQKFPAHWAGDERSNFKAFRSSIIAGLNSGVSGIPFWGWDLGGFSGPIPTAELFIRGTQMAAFCPIMQYHAESKAEFNQDRTPWNISERTADIRALDYYRYFANLRMNMLPYIYNEAEKCVNTGLPLMKALFLEYPNDKNCNNIVDEYMFGENILVAPVVHEGELERKVYLPEGIWIDFFSNKCYKGNAHINVYCGLDKIPVFIKNGSIIPLNLNKDFEFGGNITSDISSYTNLTFLIAGDARLQNEFIDDFGNKVKFKWSLPKSLEVLVNGKIDEYAIMTLIDDIKIISLGYKIKEKIQKDDIVVIVMKKKSL